VRDIRRHLDWLYGSRDSGRRWKALRFIIKSHRAGNLEIDLHFVFHLDHAAADTDGLDAEIGLL